MGGGAPDWAGDWDVVVVGGRLAGVLTAHALAPYAPRLLLLERRRPGVRWPAAVTWDRPGNLLWAGLGLTDTVLGCGAPKVRGHVRRTLGLTVRCDYPEDDEHCYRMGASREVLDAALAARAASHPNVRLLQPATAAGVLTDGGRVTGVRVVHDGVQADVRASLVVFADGRASRHVDAVGAAAHTVVRSAWTTWVASFRDLSLPADRIWYTRLPGSLLVTTPTGPGEWCVAAALHGDLVRARGGHPVRRYREVAAADPLVGPELGAALTEGRGGGRVVGAVAVPMHVRPMTGPGWCLVGDSGVHLDPMTGRGAHAVLTTVTLLRDRVRDLGGISASAADYAGLGPRRDALLRHDWNRARRAIAAYQPGPTSMERALRLAADEEALRAHVRARMGLGTWSYAL
ncbi:MAG TPA: FAD-dependent monooxygenase [Kineosporiaceae bacterium]